MLNFSTRKRAGSPATGDSSPCPAPRPIAACGVGLLSLITLLFVLAAGAAFAGGSSCPSIHNLQPANGCSTYSVSFGTDRQGHCTATFTCWNANGSNGDCVTGFACYWIGPGSCKPLCQSAPSNCQTTCWGSYCQSCWDYNCYPSCNYGGSTTCGSTGGYGSTSCGSSTSGYSSSSTSGYGSTGGTNCGGSSSGYGSSSTGGYCADYGCSSSTSGYGSSTSCGSTGGYGSTSGGYGGCWYNQCGWLPNGCITPGNCNQPTCFTLTYPCGTKLCASDFCCAVHCYQQTGCDYWCMCGGNCLGKLSVSATPSSVCITNSESTQLSYTITNTGTGNVNNVALTDNFGNLSLSSVLPTDTLTPGQSVTVTRTISNKNATFTDDISATGVDTNSSQVNAGTTVNVDVVHPALSLTASAGQMTGNQVTITYVLTNTGDDAVNGITVTGYVNGTPTVLATGISLAANGGTKTITQNVTVNGTTMVYAVASGTDSCASVPVSVTSTTVTPPATISGTVSCSTCTCPVVGATVNLLNSSTNAVVATQTTGTGGAFNFENIATGSYEVQVVDSPDYNTYTGSAFSFNSSGSNYNAGTIGLTAAPISYLSQAGTGLGLVWFGSAAFWQSYGFTLGTQTVQQSDLYTSTYVSGSTVYPYSGTIPNYPELGSFTGNIYVFVQQPLVNANVWNNSSFVDLVGLDDVWPVTGGGSEGTSGQFTIREFFDQPFQGPGTAYSYAISGLSFSSPSPAPAYTVTPEALVWTGGGTAPTTPASGTVPAGWMVQDQLQWTIPPLTTSSFYLNGSYNDICGDQFTFSICPTCTAP